MEKYLWFHIIAFGMGIILDFIVGDPYKLPHPIRMIGGLIGRLEKGFMKEGYVPQSNPVRERCLGLLMVVLVLLVSGIATAFLLFGVYALNDYLGCVVETILTCYLLAARSLQKESMKVYKALEKQDLEGARLAVSMIVGRDVMNLDEAGVAKAAVETVAENTSDGVIAPMLYTFIGGPVLGMLYKAVNTMDSMVGYHNERFEYFGSAAAKLDDIVNFLPARISAMGMLGASFLLSPFQKEFDTREGFRIFLRDRYAHKSPNSAQTESVCAGVLHLQLAGDAMYFGKRVSKPTIGDDGRKITYQDIARANRLMYGSEVLLALICISVYLCIVCLWD